MFSFTQLEQLSLKVLRSRAWAIRDQVGADRLPPVPQNNEAIVMWILDTQTAISRVVGQEYTIYDFGYPKHGLPTVDDSFFAPQPAMGELSPCVPTSAPSQARSSPLSAGKERAPIHDDRAPVPGAHTAADQAMVGAFNEATAARKAAKEAAALKAAKEEEIAAGQGLLDTKTTELAAADEKHDSCRFHVLVRECQKRE